MKSLQQLYAPNSICFGCGPKNEKGLHINSFVEGEEVVCSWDSELHHEAFPGMLNGGILGSLLDCHCNWTAAYFIMKEQKLENPLCTVTANYNIKLKRPTPSLKPLIMRSKVLEMGDQRAKIEGLLYCDDKLCATCTGDFVAVKEGHPAYHRWA